MSNVAKLKKQAAELEAKKQFDKALAVYVKLLESFDQHSGELDVALFNRVGDLMLRQGNVADAVDYYEQAVDRYAETGFFNNAIALCNKILRHSPGRASVYYKLGRISAQKGFKNDAKVNFLEYADRMQKSGRVDEAFRALKEFADLCPDQDEIRLMLAEQLTKANRRPEAIEQLQILYERYESEGRSDEAASTADRMRAMDPTVEPRSGGGRRQNTSSELIFLDLDEPLPRSSGGFPAQPQPRRPTPPRAPPPLPPSHSQHRGPVEHQRPAPPEPRASGNIPQAPSTPLDGEAIAAQGSRTPGSLTPASLTPDSLIPVRPIPPVDQAAIEREAPPPSPAHPLPTRLSPEHPIPTQPTPVQSRPAEATPVQATPVQATPVQATPVQSTPVQSTPVQSTPVQSTPVQPAAVQSTPVESMTVPPRAPIASPLEITRIGDDTLNLAKTPSESLLGLESTRLVDDDIRIAKSTPTSSLMGLEPTSWETPEATPAQRSSPPTDGTQEGQEHQHDTGELDFIESPAEPTPEADEVSIDFEFSDLTTPTAAAPPPAEVQRTPPVSSAPSVSPALDGLPLMELDDAPRATPPATRSPSAPTPRHLPSLDEMALADDLDLIDEAGPTREEDEPVSVPTPSVARRSTMVAAQSVEFLRASLETEPKNWSLHRELAEAMLEAGDREGGLRELEGSMTGAERSGDLALASSLAEEISRLEPDAVKHHQKRVEYAFRTNDRPRLIEAYVALADALLRADQSDKARTVYQRVLDLAPDEPRARTALDALVVAEPKPAEPPPGRPSTARPSGAGFGVRPPTSPPRSASPAFASTGADSGFVNLGDLLRDEEMPKDTRMVVAEQEPTGNEEADFADMLRKFKQGIAENVAPEDYQSHYDLAIAYKEMGLLDEAIAEFQKALASPTNRLPTYEALGQCFIEKEQYKLASSILSRALAERATEDQLVGVLYLLGRAAEAQGRPDEALGYYQRVFVLDIQFRDITERMHDVEQAAR